MSTEVSPAPPLGESPRAKLWASITALAWLAFALWVGGKLVFARTDALALGGQTFLLWICATFALIQTFKLFRVLAGRPRLRWLQHLIAVVGSIVLGYLISLWTIEAMYARHDRLIMERFAPLVRALEAGHDDLRVSDPRLKRTLTVLRGAGGFILTVPGASLDIDGGTVFYDSEIKRLLRFHNDLGDHPNALRFKRRRQDMAQLYPRRGS